MFISHMICFFLYKHAFTQSLPKRITETESTMTFKNCKIRKKLMQMHKTRLDILLNFCLIFSLSQLQISKISKSLYLYFN